MAHKFSYLTLAILLDLGDTECNLEYKSAEIDKQDFKIERVRLRAFVAATGNKNKVINVDPLRLL